MQDLSPGGDAQAARPQHRQRAVARFTGTALEPWLAADHSWAKTRSRQRLPCQARRRVSRALLLYPARREAWRAFSCSPETVARAADAERTGAQVGVAKQ